MDLLIEFLTKVAKHSEVNLMTVKNLGIAFGNSLMWSVALLTPELANRQNKATEMLIQHYDALLKEENSLTNNNNTNKDENVVQTEQTINN